MSRSARAPSNHVCGRDWVTWWDIETTNSRFRDTHGPQRTVRHHSVHTPHRSCVQKYSEIRSRDTNKDFFGELSSDKCEKPKTNLKPSPRVKNWLLTETQLHFDIRSLVENSPPDNDRHLSRVMTFVNVLIRLCDQPNELRYGLDTFKSRLWTRSM